MLQTRLLSPIRLPISRRQRQHRHQLRRHPASQQALIHKRTSARLRRLIGALPVSLVRPISISFLPDLAVSRHHLLPASPGRGIPVYAASFIRQRRIVFDQSLISNEPLLHFIAAHEIFHFAWARLGNRKRAEFSHILAAEIASGARGEMGESSELKKAGLKLTPEKRRSGLSGLTSLRRWRDYVCESFCDTAAWLYGDRSAKITLAKRWRDKRIAWLKATFAVPHAC